MDLDDIDNRLIIMQGLKENSENMLKEQINLRDRISLVLARARKTLASIRCLNTQVREMKLTVENALTASGYCLDINGSLVEKVPEVKDFPREQEHGFKMLTDAAETEETPRNGHKVVEEIFEN